MSESIIEQITKAIYEPLGLHIDFSVQNDFANDAQEKAQEDIRKAERTAIEAMREPTDLMGLGLSSDYKPGSHSATQIWRAMIDAALSGK